LIAFAHAQFKAVAPGQVLRRVDFQKAGRGIESKTTEPPDACMSRNRFAHN